MSRIGKPLRKIDSQPQPIRTPAPKREQPTREPARKAPAPEREKQPVPAR